MSSVFLSNVDDYLAPSQACVNPLFSESINEKKENVTNPASNEESVIVPRKRTLRRKRSPGETGVVSIPKPSSSTEVAKVSMVDCLACSGCVTSAETVLVEQHSLKTLQEKLAALDLSSTSVVFTVSLASWADILRHLNFHDPLMSKRKLATFLHHTCQASVVFDGQIPLNWSLTEAAREFCYAYKRGRESKVQPPSASIALSATQSQCLQDGSIVSHTTRSESYLPLLSSSCPALVCLVEKSLPDQVPHLATTKSSLAVAGSYFSLLAKKRTQSKHYWHVGIMPCHDKKLEASRRDFVVDGQPDVQLVITTDEWFQLIAKTCGSSDLNEIRTYLESLECAVSVTSLDEAPSNWQGVILVEGRTRTLESSHLAFEHDFFAHSSGGYADFIFRYAAKELFGFEVEGPLPWKQVSVRGIVSARVAAFRNKDYHTVALYRQADGSFTLEQENTIEADRVTCVLRFATAYGFQTLQRILQPSSNDRNELIECDYVEAMACPSGCLNGGGQIRLADRESPKETRHRVVETRRQFRALNDQLDDDLESKSNADVYSQLFPSGPFGPEAQLHLHTRYHVVPPLQHVLGAAAGVAVKDTQCKRGVELATGYGKLCYSNSIISTKAYSLGAETGPSSVVTTHMDERHVHMVR